MPAPSWVSAFDAAVREPVLALRAPVMTTFFYFCTLLANTGTIVFLTLAVVIILALRRRFAEAILVTVVVAGGQALGTVIKNIVVRQRPPVAGALIAPPGGFAFPSGHALAAALLYGVLAFLLVRGLRSRHVRIGAVAGAVVLIVLVGFSRVYLGVHWPSDVLAAWVLGGAWLALCAAVYVGWVRRHGVDPGTRTITGVPSELGS